MNVRKAHSSAHKHLAALENLLDETDAEEAKYGTVKQKQSSLLDDLNGRCNKNSLESE